MSIVTKTGDAGTTGLWSGQRVDKDDPRVEAYGAVDELSSFLGLARAAARLPETAAAVESIQTDLIRLAGELATVGTFSAPILEGDVERLADAVRALEARIPLTGFVILGRTESSARLDVARAVARRAERRIVALAREAPVGDCLRRYANRLSDLLYMLARSEEEAAGELRFAPRP